MLPVKSKYKIAKRLGAAVFEKTQSQKFVLSEARSRKDKRRGASDYGKQLLEKQRVRFTYGLVEKQLSRYANESISTENPSDSLHKALEMRLDSVVYRAGLASTRRAARQAVSHGHILVNGRRTTIPSHRVKIGDVFSVREGSRRSTLFASLTEKEEGQRSVPKWLEIDINLLQGTVVGEPSYSTLESGLDLPTVFEFYSR